MANTWVMTEARSQDVTSLSNLSDDVLYLVMMRLGAVDFPAFSSVCKSWRSLALSNRKRFLASAPPISISISTDACHQNTCHLADLDGRILRKTIIPYSAGRLCVGLTCGYLILFGPETHDFLLVNPITRHELHFPCVPVFINKNQFIGIKGILVFSPSLCGWLFVILESLFHEIWFSIAGKGAWNHVSSTSRIFGLHAFKGKIYTVHPDHLCEMRFDPKPKLTLLETKNFPKIDSVFWELLSYGENLYVIPSPSCKVLHRLDLGEMEWVCSQETTEEYEIFLSHVNSIVAVKPKSWPGTSKNQQGRFNSAYMWYFPHEC